MAHIYTVLYSTCVRGSKFGIGGGGSPGLIFLFKWMCAEKYKNRICPISLYSPWLVQGIYRNRSEYQRPMSYRDHIKYGMPMLKQKKVMDRTRMFTNRNIENLNKSFDFLLIKQKITLSKELHVIWFYFATYICRSSVSAEMTPHYVTIIFQRRKCHFHYFFSKDL